MNQLQLANHRTTRTVLAAAMLFSLTGAVTASEQAAAASEAETREASTGVIEGTVFYQADKKRPWRYARYYVKNSRTGELAEAVVAITDRSLRTREGRPQPQTVVVDQKDFRFDPETIAIQAGDRVKFTNSDNAVHNVRAVSPQHSFNVNMPAGGNHVETFDHASSVRRPYRIGCDYHSSMRAWVFVLPHPFFQVTEADGGFRLSHVPPGEYDLEMVHAAGELKWSQKVIVEAGKTMKVEIRVGPDDRIPDQSSRQQLRFANLVFC